MRRAIFGLVGVLALSIILGSGSPALAAGSVNDFTIPDYKITYYLSKDSQNVSKLKTIENITADFPITDQNHGLERAIPNTYDGHSTSLVINSVTDANNNSLPYTILSSGYNTVLRIGDPNTYVHGAQTYKITYSQQNVTKYFANTNDDEFYWDTNGTEWAVPINNLSVQLNVSDQLAGSLNGKRSCYVGASGSTNTCPITLTSNQFSAGATNLSPYQNISIAVGFKPNTFAAYKETTSQKLLRYWALVLLITIPLSIIIIISLLVIRYRKNYRLSEIHTIVPEYSPPKDVSVSVAATVAHKPAKVFTAQLIDLAVRGYLKIYQTGEKSLFRSAQYQLEITKDISTLKLEEQEVLKDIFDSTEIGAKLDMSTLKRNTSVTIKLSDNQKKVDKDMVGYGLKARSDQQTKFFKRISLIVLIIAILTLSPALLIVSLICLIVAITLKPLTDSGLELERYLKGLEMYIGVAEADRIRMLQSPEGAEKLGETIDINDKRQLIKLYERLLPYAIIFGQEKNWNNQLGQYYETTSSSPVWYSGYNNAVFNAAVFSSAMNNFSQSASYASSSSSSSGGSGGGGFSGGGGGGGGGGGW